MKKIFSILIIVILFCTGCSHFTDNSKYPFDYLGIYDTLTKQYINIGDPKEHIDEVLGYGKQNNKSDYYYDYVNMLRVVYDKPPTDALGINIGVVDDNVDSSRFEIPGEINTNSTLTDFLEKYPYTYSCDSVLYNNVKTFVKKSGDKYSFVDKSELEKIFSGSTVSVGDAKLKSDDFNSIQIYEISIIYASYSEIKWIGLSEIHSLDCEKLMELENKG